jgi:subtilisin
VIQVADVQAAQTVPPEWVRNELGGATGAGIRVAVLDSGWDRSIDDPRVLPGVGFVDPNDDFALARNDDDHDVLGHGTACADVILGVAPDARIIPVKVFGKKLETSPHTLQMALLWALDAGVQVINVSLGTRLKHTLRPLYAICERARQAGIIVVAAGHNANKWSYPAIFENVIGVSAGRFESPYHFHYRAKDAMECVGWGVERPVLWVGGERVVRHGTSFAAPGVAGIVALILERHPGAKIEDVRRMLAGFALPGGKKRRKPTASLIPAASPAADARPKRTAKSADQAVPAREPAKPRKRATAAPDATPAKSATKRKRAAAAPDAAPAKSRKRATAVPDATPAKADTKRKRTTATADAAPAKAPAKSRKRTPETAPIKSDTKPKRAAKVADQVTKAPATPRKRAATASDSATPAKAPAKPRKAAAAKPEPKRAAASSARKRSAPKAK